MRSLSCSWDAAARGTAANFGAQIPTAECGGDDYLYGTRQETALHVSLLAVPGAGRGGAGRGRGGAGARFPVPRSPCPAPGAVGSVGRHAVRGAGHQPGGRAAAAGAAAEAVRRHRRHLRQAR